jgi:DHA1 family bicyclomycin/chloramphenicol resistance-like MFS transporter
VGALALVGGTQLNPVLLSRFSPERIALFAVALVMSSTAALALSRHGEAAGTAAAVLGAVQFGLGSLLVPLVGESFAAKALVTVR